MLLHLDKATISGLIASLKEGKLNSKKLLKLSEELGEILISQGKVFTAAESCTGGWLGKSITSLPGSSNWFCTSFVTYSYSSKTDVLGVNSEDLINFGAVDERIASQMVSGALKISNADVGVAITGIAGPTGATETKPVGTVCFSWKLKDQDPLSVTEHFDGDREKVRFLSVERALQGTIEALNKRN